MAGFNETRDSYTFPNGQVVNKVPAGVSEEQILAWGAENGYYKPVNYTQPIGARDIGRSAAQGLTFGFGDELASGLAAGLAKVSGEKAPYGQIYEDILQSERQGLEQFREQHPVAAYGTEAIASIPTALAGGARMLQGAQKIAPSVAARTPQWLAASGAGASEGGLYGAGVAEDDRLTGAAGGAGAGAVGGGLGYFLINKLGIPTAKMLWRKISSAPKTDADRLIRQALQDSGMTPDEIQSQLRELGPDAVLADLEGQLSNLARTSHSMPTGQARRTAEEFLTKRDLAQQEQLWNTAKRISGTEGNTVKSIKTLEAAQRKAAEPAYRKAYSHQIMRTPALRDVLELDDVKSAYTLGKRMAANEAGKKAGGKAFVDGEWVDFPNMQEWDWIQRGLRAKAESAYGQEGGKAVGRSYRLLRSQILDELDSINPDFAKARQIYAKGEALKDAVDKGKRFINEDVDVLDDLIDGMTESEKQAYMVGAMNTIRNKVLSPGETRDITKIPLFQSPMIRQRLETVFGKDKAGELLTEAQKLAQKRRTKNMIMSRSPTADIMAGQRETTAFDMAQAAGTLAGDPGSAVGMLGRFAQPPRLSPETATILGNQLFDPNVNVAGLLPPQSAPPSPMSTLWPGVLAGQQAGRINSR